MYDIEKLSIALSYVVEPEGLIFAKDIKIDDDAPSKTQAIHIIDVGSCHID